MDRHRLKTDFDLGNGVAMHVLTREDADDLFQLVDQNRDHLREWLGWLDGTISAADTQNTIDKAAAEIVAGTAVTCGVFWKDRLVGMCSLRNICRGTGLANIGYWLSPDAEGQGTVTRCVAAFISHALEDLGLDEVQISVAEANRKSRAICDRLGLSQIGIKAGAETLYGVSVDHALYAISKRAWRKRA